MFFVLLGEWNPPEYDIHNRVNTFQPYKREARAESHRCAVNRFGKLACNFSTLLRFLEGNLFRKSLNGMTDFRQKGF